MTCSCRVYTICITTSLEEFNHFMRMQTYKTQRIHLYIGIVMLLIALGSFGIASAQTMALTQEEKERVTSLAANTANRTGAALERLANISTRLEERIRLLENDGYNMALTWEHTGNANASIEEAGARLLDMQTRVLTMVDSANPLEEWGPIKTDFFDAQQDLIDAQQFMRQAIAAIKTSMENGREVGGAAMEADMEAEGSIQVQ